MKNSLYPSQLPSPLQPGDKVKVIAPSGALKELEALEKGLEIWRSRGYKVELGSNWHSHYGYLAGNDNQRRQALVEAWCDPECKAILCLRGGYGGARLLENWSWEEEVKSQKSKVKSQKAGGRRQEAEEIHNLKSKISNLQSPINNLKWIIGFSDVTSLLWSLATVGIAGIHAPVLTTLAAEPEWSINRLFDYLGGGKLQPLQGEGWSGGKAEGFLLPANLTVATHLLKTPIQPSFKKVILALEDVTEAPYRIDRMLTQWRLMGAFKQIKGIALGRFSRCDAPVGTNSWSVKEVLSDRLQDLNIPIVAELPFGHDGVNAALPVGQWVQLDAEQGILSWEE
jgi:muramoyltetrapeptide carboxypeptidase